MTLRVLLALASLFLVTACGTEPGVVVGDGTGGGGISGEWNEVPPRCGDGLVNQLDEECDGNDLPSTCTDLDLPAGTIGCTEGCKFDVSACRDEIRSEDCSTPGDEDGNGLADCDDPACGEHFDCPVCGDGIVQAGEACDGGAPETTCIDAGFELGTTSCSSQCEPDTTACRNPTCGDGEIEGTERCDDGNQIDSDGCSSACQIEGDDCSSVIALDTLWDERLGYWQTTIDTADFAADFSTACNYPVAVPDAVVSFTAPNAGTWEFRAETPSYRIHAWSGSCEAPDEQLACSGDQTWLSPSISVDMEAGETIHIAVKGPELGELTITARSVVCGDGVVAGEEECDDGNTLNGDDCGAGCRLPGTDCLNPFDLNQVQVKPDGWSWLDFVHESFPRDQYAGTCGGSPGLEVVASFTAPEDGTYEIFSAKTSVNGVLHIWEKACGPVENELVCTNSAGDYGVLTATLDLLAQQTIFIITDNLLQNYHPHLISVHRLDCGNGFLNGTEECDDGNTIDSDGCSATCLRETTNEVEPNDGFATATPLSSPGRGELASPADVDFWSIELTAGVETTFVVRPRFSVACDDYLDTTLALYDSAGTELLRNDGVPYVNACSTLVFTPTTTGTYFVEVAAGNHGRADSPYLLWVN